jgi:hypothetical protein
MFSDLGTTFLYVKFRIIPGELAWPGETPNSRCFILLMLGGSWPQVPPLDHLYEEKWKHLSVARGCLRFTASDKVRKVGIFWQILFLVSLSSLNKFVVSALYDGSINELAINHIEPL